MRCNHRGAVVSTLIGEMGKTSESVEDGKHLYHIVIKCQCGWIGNYKVEIPELTELRKKEKQ